MQNIMPALRAYLVFSVGWHVAMWHVGVIESLSQSASIAAWMFVGWMAGACGEDIRDWLYKKGGGG